MQIDLSWTQLLANLQWTAALSAVAAVAGTIAFAWMRRRP